TIQNKVRGSLVGGACGDALGYPVEFVYSFEEIKYRYGGDGVQEYDMSYPWLDRQHRPRKALFSDDTQMTLYTAEALLEAEKSDTPLLKTICEAYLIWFGHQADRKVKAGYKSALSEIDELNQRRAPGNTCMSALLSIYRGKVADNNSKGCGGVMRVAPIGLYGAIHGWSLQETARIAGEAAAITHLHPLSTYSSAALAVIVQQCVNTEHIDRETFKLIVEDTLSVITGLYGESAPAMNDFLNVIHTAIRGANTTISDWEIIEIYLGGGWVAEETLAIAIFSVLRHIDDFSGCLVCAVNHGGDSDSTGAVAGNIIGAIVGYNAIPTKFTVPLQLHELIIDMADALLTKLTNTSKTDN
ncbi:MAG: ADP-ribosylglycohydrolase family protein, partial [Muribaculaceae bacterium]|nr:ADP-ribosylglycohydrolase family protein [Muribaculaceae bacterium]